MANRRMIASDIFEDDFIGSLSFFERLLWIGLFCAVVDDQGRSFDAPALIRSKVFLFDTSVTDDKVEQALVKLATAGKVIRYTANGKKLLQIAKWWIYQTPSWASPSKYPPPPNWIDRIKYHNVGNNIVMLNWDKKGGVSIPLPTRLGSGIEEVEGEVKDEDDVKGEDEVEDESAPEGAITTTTTGTQADENICRIYEREVGVLTPILGELLGEIEREYPPGWFVLALREAKKSSTKINLKYVEAILRRWKTEGLPKNGRKRPSPPDPSPKMPLSTADGRGERMRLTPAEREAWQVREMERRRMFEEKGMPFERFTLDEDDQVVIEEYVELPHPLPPLQMPLSTAGGEGIE